jgi:multiple sugar transport system permease protein
MRTQRAAWWFVAPALIVLGVFFFLPVLAALVMSLTDFDLYALDNFDNLRWIGFENYCAAAARAPVLEGARQHLVLRRARRADVDRRVARRGVARELEGREVSRLVPDCVLRAGGDHARRRCRRVALHLSYALRISELRAGAVGRLDPIDWMGNPHWAMPAIVILAVWKNFGYNMIILLAALQNIPDDLYEAARIDGASGWQQFRHVTLPGIGSVLLLVSILTMTGYFQLFAEPYVMTEGGPLQATYSVLYFMFEEGFKWWSLGRASAVAFLLFILMFLVTVVQLRLGRERSDA